MTDAKTSIADFLNAAAAKTPTPGGGAIAALAGALAASMGEMVLQYSVAKKDLAAFSELNQNALDRLTRARAVLTELLVEDQAVFQAYSDAKKRGDDLTELTDACIRVPQTIGATAIAILDIANCVVESSNRWLLSDLAVCGELAMATVRCAIHNVRVNLASVEDSLRREELEAECQNLLQQGLREIQRLIPAIDARLK